MICEINITVELFNNTNQVSVSLFFFHFNDMCMLFKLMCRLAEGGGMEEQCHIG